MKLLKISIFLALIVCTASCKKQIKDDQKNQQSTPHSLSTIDECITIVNGRLHFADNACLEALVTEFESMTIEDVQSWESQFDYGSYHSLRAKYEEIDADTESVSVDSMFQTNSILYVPDRILATIFNDQGEFMVGDTIHVLEQDTERLIVDGDEYTLLYGSFWGANVINVPIESPLLGSSYNKTNNFSWRGTQTFFQTKDVNGNNLPQKNGRQTRFKGKEWNVSYYYFGSIGAEGTYEAKNSRGNFKDEEASRIQIYYNDLDFDQTSWPFTWFSPRNFTASNVLMVDHTNVATRSWRAISNEAARLYSSALCFIGFRTNWWEGYMKAHYNGVNAEIHI